MNTNKKKVIASWYSYKWKYWELLWIRKDNKHKHWHGAYYRSKKPYKKYWNKKYRIRELYDTSPYNKYTNYWDFD